MGIQLVQDGSALLLNFSEEDEMAGMKRNVVLAVAVAAAVATPAAFATNGYFTEGIGTLNRGMAGAGGAALPQDSFTSATNPAGLVKVGERLDISAGIFAPKRSYELTNSAFPSSLSSQDGDQDKYFLIPGIGYSWKIDANNAAAVSAYGQGGMQTNYKDSIFGTGNMGVNLSQLFINGSFAHRMDSVSLGASAILAYQRFKAYGLQGFDPSLGGMPFTSSPGNVTNNGYDNSTGFGVQVGALWDVTSDVSLGLSYRSKIKGKFDKYKGLFAEGGEFDIPSTYDLGAAWKVSPTVDVALDYVKIKYTDSKAVSNSIDCLTAGTCQLGSDNGPGFGWKDINVYKLGAQLKGTNGWTWRVGWNHGDNPIPNNQTLFNILAPGVVQDHLNFGFTKAIDKTSDFNFMAMHAFKKDVTGDVPAAFTSFGYGTQAKISLEENYVEFGYSKKF